jgi:hypothetical protein
MQAGQASASFFRKSSNSSTLSRRSRNASLASTHEAAWKAERLKMRPKYLQCEAAEAIECAHLYRIRPFM